MARKQKAVQKTRRVAQRNSSGETVYVTETYTDYVTDYGSSSSCDTSSSYSSDSSSSSSSCD